MMNDRKDFENEEKCLPRKWFGTIKGTVLEEQVLAQNKVVSIQSRNGWMFGRTIGEETI